MRYYWIHKRSIVVDAGPEGEYESTGKGVFETTEANKFLILPGSGTYWVGLMTLTFDASHVVTKDLEFRPQNTSIKSLLRVL